MIIKSSNIGNAKKNWYYDGICPDTIDKLVKLLKVGCKTANCTYIWISKRCNTSRCAGTQSIHPSGTCTFKGT